MFQGHSICSIDNKSRIILPAKFRKYINPEANNKFIITRGIDQCLLMYPLDEWLKVQSALLNYNPLDAKQRHFVREFLLTVNEVELDSQNRILIPTQLLEFAELTKEAMVIGILDKLEIWSPEIKKKYDDSQNESYEDVAQNVSEIFMKRNV